MKKIILTFVLGIWAVSVSAKTITEIQEWTNGTYWVLYDNGTREQISEDKYAEILSKWIREEINDKSL